MLKQWRSVGQYEINDLDKFKEMMDIPASYSNSRITARCITPAITELTETKSFEDLAVRPIRKGIGGTICGYIFTFTPEKASGTATYTRAFEKTSEPPKSPNGKNKFNNFTQRSYDFAELEKLLLSTDPQD